MARLTPAGRAQLSDHDFAGPGRSYPVYDADHAKAAIIDSARGVKAGHITEAQRARIVSRAEKVLGK